MICVCGENQGVIGRVGPYQGLIPVEPIELCANNSQNSRKNELILLALSSLKHTNLTRHESVSRILVFVNVQNSVGIVRIHVQFATAG